MTPFAFFLDWRLDCQFAGLLWALKRGLYEDAGLAVDLVTPDRQPGTSPLHRLHDDECAAACSEENLVVRACALEGGMRAIGVLLQQSPLVLMTAAASGIASWHDLAGRRIAMHRDGLHLLRILLSLDGVNADDVEIVVEDWTLDDLLAGRVDAAQGYAVTEAVELVSRGFESRLIPLRHRLLSPQSQVIAATKRAIAAHEDALRRFLTASSDGWRQVLSRPDEAAELVAQHCPTHPDPALNRKILDMMAPLVLGPDGTSRPGAIDRARWRQNLATYARFGMIDRPLTLGEVVDDRFLA